VPPFDEPVVPVAPDEVTPVEPDVVVDPLDDVLPPELPAPVVAVPPVLEELDRPWDEPAVKVARGGALDAQPATTKASKSCHPVCLVVIAAKPSTPKPPCQPRIVLYRQTKRFGSQTPLQH
jgi:hypothetical protein